LSHELISHLTGGELFYSGVEWKLSCGIIRAGWRNIDSVTIR